MEMRELTIRKRDGIGKGPAKRLRRSGQVPATLYGASAPVNIAVTPKDMLRLIHGHEGESVGIKDAAGILEMVLREVRVSCLPGNIPEFLEADVTNLNIHDVLTVKDLKVPDGVRVLNDPNQAVVTVAPPAAEEVAAVTTAPTEVAAAEPEVLTERKPKEEAGEADKAGGEKKK